MSEENQTTDPAKVDAENLPSVRAFEDKFTREFLQSIEETRDGYYPFKSKTNHYVMDFPEGGLVGERGYSLQDNSESYLVGVEGEDTDSQISIKYLGFMKHEFKDSRIETLIDSSEATLKFDTKDLDDRSISTAFFKEDNGYFGYVGLIQNSIGNGAVEVTYTSECKENVSKCEEVMNREKNIILDWIHSIKFINENGREETDGE
ncbi:hypothetical protein [Guptibacillus hwajinpoensis]|uniref:hypothetical protein n=1 Tax=Guptibacillus hwajinpoensis TaxID=208199 RepID=UPI001CFDA16D|nr:hypothetical protein [Pseudalkalibacillus hwajinpoensis]WLR61488.1 hypothetical protein LC071_09460 [Pseudalkalibacillus hwajinpoensis]